MSRPLSRLLLPAAALLLAAGPGPGLAPPGELWFKVKTRAVGYSAADGEKPFKGSGTELNYLRVAPVATTLSAGDSEYPALPGETYRFEIWANGPGGWQLAYSTDETLEACDGLSYFVSDLQVIMPFKDGEFAGYVTAMLKVKRDKQGAITSARFTTLGGELYDGVLHDGVEGDRCLRGGLKMSGNAIPASKLPFSPKS